MMLGPPPQLLTAQTVTRLRDKMLGTGVRYLIYLNEFDNNFITTSINIIYLHYMASVSARENLMEIMQ